MTPFPDSPLAPEDVPSPVLSVETLAFLSELLRQVTVSAADPNFEKAAATVAKARRELDAALTNHDQEQQTR